MDTVRQDAVRPLALVTGASGGIGRELARQFARNGFDLVVCAEDAGVEDAARELREYGARVRAVRADLALHDGVEQVYAALVATRRPVAAAALNAGVGLGGAFLDQDLADAARVVDVNITATVHLAHRLLPDMVDADEGRVLITSSVASMMPGAFQAVYNASKSFLQSFAQALQEELRDTGVTVTSLMPGPTETAFFHRAGMDDTPVGRQEKDDPADVARQGFEAMMAGRDKVVAGSARTKAQGLAAKVLPDRLKAAGHRRMAEPEEERPA
ncbi:SDR family oxidoreductase [Streptomyces sp. ODS05-4]|uniref:SDR family NAD(P)-dependent oxidoreductase n=1 Tax=Streptomyces sp. ODS05-4 TaxID=2944939 RepID=UPI00210D39D6|nr:SDR family NAD(P)-dependent oxidoreductase [Streptomyces sp. ODS05-4]